MEGSFSRKLPQEFSDHGTGDAAALLQSLAE